MNDNTTRVWCDSDTPLGRLTLSASDAGLDGLFFPGRAPARDGADHCPERFEQAVVQLEEYFTGTRTQFDLAIDLSGGTPFQRAVWQELQAISFGETISYGELADRLGRPDRARAVGAAVGRTPLPIVVPCHRVVSAGGKLTGYLGGLQRKQALLDMEAAVRSGHSVAVELGHSRQLSLL
jgi:methylated-DNA-[protein]-cysteine S-methyltransferase